MAPASLPTLVIHLRRLHTTLEPLLVYARLPAAAAGPETPGRMDATAGPPPQTLPGPLAVLTARPEGEEGELGPECTYYVLGTAHVSSGGAHGLPAARGAGWSFPRRRRRRRCLPTAHPTPRPAPLLSTASCCAESCEDVAKLIRAVKPQVRAPRVAAAAAASCLPAPFLTSTLLADHPTHPLHPTNLGLPLGPPLARAAGGSRGAVQRAQAHPDCRQDQGAQPGRGAERDPGGAGHPLPRHLLLVRINIVHAPT